MEKQMIIVDEKDREKGVAGKMETHTKGLLHRAFSVFIFNRKGEMLLQQRAMNKYHSGGLWTNACCSHPQPGEDTKKAAIKRLKEEMGFETTLKKLFDFVYKVDFENGLIEHEFDHVFVGEYDGLIHFSNDEVMACSYKNMQDIADSLEKNPTQYTTWFRLAFPGIEKWWSESYKNSVA
jgi:isopentenyl-diphosphate delta-isomerase